MKKKYRLSDKAGMNLLGFLLSLGAVFGGFFLVQHRLNLETGELLKSGGQILSPQHSLDTTVIAEPLEATVYTQEDHLLRFLKDLKRQAAAVPHDPLPGQLSMGDAVKKARDWLEEFFMPQLSETNFRLSEYKTDCYLWAVPEEEETEQNPLYSYWSITLRSRDLEAVLILNALTGQILDVFVICAPPAGYQAAESLPALLDGYAEALRPDDSLILLIGEDQLEIEEKTFLLPDESAASTDEGQSSGETGRFQTKAAGDSPADTDSLLFYQSLGSHDLYAAASAGSVLISSPESPEHAEFLSLRLYLSYDPMTPPESLP